MNANELADKLKAITGYSVEKESQHDSIQQAATMLHQQQERIKQLEETQEYLYKTHDADKAEIEDLKAKLQLHEAMDNQCASLMQQFRKASEK